MNEIPSGLPLAAQTDYAQRESNMKRQKEEMDATVSQLKNIARQKPAGAGFDARQELSRIAAATTRAQVKFILNRLGAKIGHLKNTAGNADIVKRIKKVMGKGSEKIKHLLYEERIAKKAELAEKKRELEESKKLRDNLAARRMNRKLREQEDVKNANLITSSGSISNSSTLAPSICPDTTTAAAAPAADNATATGEGISIYV